MKTFIYIMFNYVKTFIDIKKEAITIIVITPFFQRAF